MSLPPVFDNLPASLRRQAEHYRQGLGEGPWGALEPEQQQRLNLLFAMSEFIGARLSRDGDWLPEFFRLLSQHLRHPQYRATLDEELARCQDEASAKRVLRRFRHRQMVVIAARDFLNLAPLDESLAHLSEMAQSLILAARDWLTEYLASRFGYPRSAAGERQPLLILGMGKLGGGELNFSSDIDLIFTYPENGTTDGPRQLDNQQYFIRMGQKLIGLLADVELEGFCFRVDMRLRPFGEAGPLAVSFDAIEDYYQEQGREWERYAMVKARAMGEGDQASALHTLLRPFIYRRYLDFSAIDALRRMKALIESQLRRSSLTDNIKLGRGGIREVEFVVQSHQLIRGGRQPALRRQPLMPVLAELARSNCISGRDHKRLLEGYRFLRRLENLLQALSDKQTQTLPDNPDDQLRLSLSLEFDSWEALRETLSRHMSNIHEVFRETIGGDEQEEEELGELPALWQHPDPDVSEILSAQGLDSELAEPLMRLRGEFARRTIGPRGRDTLDKLMPRLLGELAGQPGQSELLQRMMKVVATILTRTTYLELLLENPAARQQLVRLCAASPWIADQLAAYPILLDELIDPMQLYQVLPPDGYAASLREFLMRVPEEDLEQQMEALRQFKQISRLHIAAADVTGVLPVMKVSDHLTWLAEAIVEQVVQLAWNQLVVRHGLPSCAGDGKGFAVVAYGKMGGLELGYGSDLDLVFLHRADNGYTSGDKGIDNNHFYLKLAQRVLHLFSTRTLSGILYEVDMRLRPSGASGLLVSHIDRYDEYQRQEAWTWEHQALVRARMVFGEPAMVKRFNEIRESVLCLPRHEAQLNGQVREMREKMRDHLHKGSERLFDLKQGPGGITDIEFITQYLVLAHGHRLPQMSRWSDNVRILELALQLGLLSAEEADLLVHTYTEIRDTNHHRVLAGLSGLLPHSEKPEGCEAVAALWSRIFDKDHEKGE
ncbi:bifunctional [glutamate--ammonia ligase]-adenylyl-L-tyrosine phosphorylase/[glutamate--ammonia-ligase] adenylyltransferase [Ferrimonas sediminicola]|uniref:Bifunctional glutamine synthetase adenylyltransferase/adenylyl-removing enzyme n=1 Tax=Ferrimonas sediminicola TaxID=2569538 RepID=A0A4U1BMV1_9GAMM|nr:bifunctional [glutamate--ammonia ligase]-adenylyl-L-tyrosine phosphorylase/[glutamate--ammonia-ligase] adenylyltransferase [Ferrimonas sediminicola]TKB51448.1 bifunctional [glutamate--ammonia ligase]-adenylyl-L-tyrosine phosphorylase/[glutamate--ammonia-ligase] adenylyltransferase [Ferrimonas sediminicola]